MDPLPNHKQKLIAAVVALVALAQGFANDVIGADIGWLNVVQGKVEDYSTVIVVGSLWALRLFLKRNG